MSPMCGGRSLTRWRTTGRVSKRCQTSGSEPTTSGWALGRWSELSAAVEQADQETHGGAEWATVGGWQIIAWPSHSLRR